MLTLLIAECEPRLDEAIADEIITNFGFVSGSFRINSLKRHLSDNRVDVIDIEILVLDEEDPEEPDSFGPRPRYFDVWMRVIRGEYRDDENRTKHYYEVETSAKGRTYTECPK